MGKQKPKIELATAEQFIAQGRQYDAAAGNASAGNSVTRVTESLEAKDNSSADLGRGIVERADGTKKRRLVVYVTPQNAKILKAVAALTETDMSTIVDDLLDTLRETQNVL